MALHYLLNNNFVCGQILTVGGGESLANMGKMLQVTNKGRVQRRQ